MYNKRCTRTRRPARFCSLFASPVNLAFDCFNINECNKIEVEEEKKKKTNINKSEQKAEKKDKLKQMKQMKQSKVRRKLKIQSINRLDDKMLKN